MAALKEQDIHRAMALLAESAKAWVTPAVTLIAHDRDPFKVLVSCILSLRTRDETTARASERLFARAATPQALSALSETEIEAAIFPVGFYRNKAVQLREISRQLLQRYQGRVPDEIDELLKFKGVGRKTANLVVTLGYGKPGICVDTHVHRICNRWGYIRTKNPAETETALRLKLPAQYWITINDLLVSFGQNHCFPISPRCSTCPLLELCDRVGVTTSR